MDLKGEKRLFHILERVAYKNVGHARRFGYVRSRVYLAERALVLDNSCIQTSRCYTRLLHTRMSWCVLSEEKKGLALSVVLA